MLYSKIEADRHFVGWTRVGDNIRYYKNDQIQAGVFFFSTNISFAVNVNKQETVTTCQNNISGWK